MKIRFLKSMLCALVGLTAVSINATANVEQVVATVNGTPIMESQVKRALGNKKVTEANRRAAVDSIIDNMLVQKAIKDANVKINYKKVDQIIEGIAAQNGLTFGQLLDVLDYQKISYNAYREKIAQQMLMAEVRNRNFGKNINVSREQVEALAKKMLDEAKAKGTVKATSGTEYEVRHILIKLNPLLNDNQAKAELSQVRADILAGKKTFTQAAQEYSKDFASAANGGNLGFAFPEAYVGEFNKTVKTTKVGTISQPFKTEFGWHILEVTNTRQGDRTEDAYRQKAYETIVNQQIQEEQQDWIKGLRRGAEIKYLN